MTPRATRLTLLALIAAIAGAMTWLAVYQVDDAFIVYRYARNLAHGAGFVFNPGERVEGVTCFLWTVALAPWSALGLDLPKIAPVLTAACGLATVALIARRHADIEGREALGLRDLLPSLLLGATPAFLYWSVGALETVPFAYLVTLAVRSHAREASAASRLPRSALWLGLASLVRPETPVIVAALGADRLWRAQERGALRAGVRETARWMTVVAAGFVPFLLFRRLYFGAWLPNTYDAKAGAPLTERALAGWLYLQDCAASLVPSFGAQGVLVISLGLVLLAGLLVVALSDPRWRPEGLIVVALAIACIFEGGDWMVLHRFFVPALPAIAVIAGALLLRGAAAGRFARAVALTIVLAWVANGGARAAAERNGGRGLLVQSEGYRHAHLEVAKYLAGHAKAGDAVALMDVGMIGWFAPALDLVDITGLTDRAIARAPGGFIDKRYPVADLLARRPKFIVIVPGFPADERIHGDPAFQTGYTLRLAVNHRFNWDPPDAYYLHVFERNAP